MDVILVAYSTAVSPNFCGLKLKQHRCMHLGCASNPSGCDKGR